MINSNFPYSSSYYGPSHFYTQAKPLPIFSSNPAAPAPKADVPLDGKSLEDPFLDPKLNLSSREALSFFSVGFVLLALGPLFLKAVGAERLWETALGKRLIQQRHQLKEAVIRNWQRTGSARIEKAKKRLEELFPGMKSFFRTSDKNPQGKPTAANLKPGNSNFDSATLNTGKMEKRELQVYQNYNDSLSSIYRLIQLDPTQGGALLIYVGTSVLGYIAGSFVQGSQETWVRQQETKIRAKLIGRLQSAFRQSIRLKTEADNHLRERVRSQIYALLKSAGIPEADELVQDYPVLESPQTQRLYFYQPTHRDVQFGQDYPGLAPVELGLVTQNHPTRLSPLENPTWQKSLVAGLGAFGGYVSRKFIQLLADGREGDPDTVKASLQEGLMLKDRESWSMIGVKNGRNFLIMSGFFAMSAAAAIGKVFLDGLREVKVTRLNARTELAYQQHNWLTQDPLFHTIAEEETVNNQLQQLRIDLPCLRFDRAALQKRIQVILGNIGRNSAPPYYPMTPTVGLVEARA